jgi:hypothetical protein
VSAGGVTWTYFVSPFDVQGAVGRNFLYDPAVRMFGTSFVYPGRVYGTWDVPFRGPDKTDKIRRTRRDIGQQDASSGQHGRVKRFFPYMYGGMPGMMGGYGNGMASSSASAFASASAMGTGWYGSYGYPFFG